MSQGGNGGNDPNATNGANIPDDARMAQLEGEDAALTAVGAPHVTTAEATHGAADILAEALARTDGLFGGQQRSAADAALAQEPWTEASEEFIRTQTQAGKKKADGEETEEFDIASPADNPELELEAKRAAMIKAQEELEEAEKKAQAHKDKEDKEKKEKEDKEKKDHEEARSSGGGVGQLPPGMSLPNVRVHPEAATRDEAKAMQETMMQLMAQVHSLSKDLKEMQDRFKERDETIDKLHAGSAPNGSVREFGKGPPQPVDKKITERPKKYTGNIHEFFPWQEKLKIFLESQDPRWRAILDQIEEPSLKPMTEQGFAQVAVAANVLDHMETFQMQLYQYLELFTAGDAHKMVLANKAAKSFETWRMFTDKKSVQKARAHSSATQSWPPSSGDPEASGYRKPYRHMGGQQRSL